MDDYTLGYQFVAGSEKELEQVMNRYGKQMLRYATTILCDYQEAENIVQDVFIAAYQNRTTFDGKNLSAWLYKITYNKCMNQLKKPKLLYFSEIKAKAVTAPDEDTGTDAIIILLSKLKPKERALLYGRIIEQMSYEELSGLFGQSAVSLRKKYERSKKKLAKYLIGIQNPAYGKE